MEDELLLLEQQVRRNDAEVEEEEFWQNELHIEQESERRLRQQLVELRGRVRDCESKLSEYLARIQVSPPTQRSCVIPAFLLHLQTAGVLSCASTSPTGGAAHRTTGTFSYRPTLCREQ